MTLQQLQVRKDDLSTTRLVDEALPVPGEGEILVRVERFALTANNVTYGVVGERIGYWNFFPPFDNADGGWGLIPVWGFAEIIQSNVPELRRTERLYGYFPMASHLVMKPEKITNGRLIDGAAHRSQLPPVYNGYQRVDFQPGYDQSMDNERMVLHPLYATSFCLHDFLVDNDWFGARQVIIASASSKTALGLAYALADDANAPISIGLTSAGNLQRVKALGLYDDVYSYDDLKSIDAGQASVIIDMSGSGSMLSDLHAHLGDNMRYCSNVGVTHWSDNKMGAGFIRERSAMFFAPGHIQKRTKEWGPGVFEKKANAFWHSAAERSRAWLNMDKVSGLAATQPVFQDLRSGLISPHSGLVITLD